MDSTPQYQRAVTPTIDTAISLNAVRGKVLSYQTSQKKGKQSEGTSLPLASNPSGGGGQRSLQARPQQRGAAGSSFSNEITIQGRSAAANSARQVGASLPPSTRTEPVLADPLQGTLQRFDLIPLQDEIPADGIIFARVRNQVDSLVVYRTPEERQRNPERLNLDRRQLEVCPILEMEHRLRLLNFQNNNIRMIQNLENLPNLIFLDLYNNKLMSLEGPVSLVKGLRVLMAGKNRINTISNLSTLRKLDVLDLHSNEIRQIEGLETLTDLRVLNLAGNRISMVENLSNLNALTELNLRRNKIERVIDLDQLPALQRVFLSHNEIKAFKDINCIFGVGQLIELSLDGNPMADADPVAYRNRVIASISSLRHLDLKRITDEDRTQAIEAHAASLVQDSSLGVGNRGMGDGGGTEGGAGEGSGRGEGAEDGGGTGDPAAPSPSKGAGLAALARAGRISSQQTLFDVEITGPNEKALVAVGDQWDWVQARRLLATVTEASLFHMKKDTILNKFFVNISWLPLLRIVRFVNNEIDSLPVLQLILDAFGPLKANIEHFSLQDNPLCSSLRLARALAICALPSLKTFNDDDVTAQDRLAALHLLKPVLQMYKLTRGAQAQSTAAANSGGVSSGSAVGAAAVGGGLVGGSVAGTTARGAGVVSSGVSRKMVAEGAVGGGVGSGAVVSKRSVGGGTGARSLGGVADLAGASDSELESALSAGVESRRQSSQVFEEAFAIVTKNVIRQALADLFESRR